MNDYPKAGTNKAIEDKHREERREKRKHDSEHRDNRSSPSIQIPVNFYVTEPGADGKAVTHRYNEKELAAWRSRFLKKTPTVSKPAAAKPQMSDAEARYRQKFGHAPPTEQQVAARFQHDQAEAFKQAGKDNEEIEKFQASLQAIDQQFDPKTRLKSGSAFPKLMDLLGSSGQVQAAMAHLDKAKLQPFVYYKNEKTETHIVLRIFGDDLAKMAEDFEQIALKSKRDLVRILREHQGEDGQRKILSEVEAALEAAFRGASSAARMFRNRVPDFAGGMQLLLSAVRLNQSAGEKVTDWSNEVIAAAQEHIDNAILARDLAVGALATVVIVLLAPVAGAAMGTTFTELQIGSAGVVLGAGTKAALHVSDFLVAGKKVAWSEITFGFLLDVVVGIYGKWFENGIKPDLSRLASSRLGTALQGTGATATQIEQNALELCKEVNSQFTEQLNGFVSILWKEQPEDKKSMARSEYFLEQVRERFTLKAATDILLNRLSDRLNGAALTHASAASAKH